MLQTLQPQALNAIRDDGWEEVEMAVDSGASETVVGEDMIATARMKESEGSRMGYRIQSGKRGQHPQLRGKEIQRVDARRSQEEYHCTGVLSATRTPER